MSGSKLHLYACVRMHTYVRTRIHSCMYTHMHASTHTYTHAHTHTHISYMLIHTVALMLGIILYVLDSAKGSNINISAKKRKALAKKEEEEATSGSDNVSNEDE